MNVLWVNTTVQLNLGLFGLVTQALQVKGQSRIKPTAALENIRILCKTGKILYFLTAVFTLLSLLLSVSFVIERKVCS